MSTSTPSDPPERPRTAPDGGPYNPAPGAEATVLAEVRHLRDRVERVHRLHTELASSVAEELAPVLAEMRQDLTDQQTQLRRVLGRLDAERTPPVNWPALTAEQAAEQWDLLGGWIAEVLMPWYEVTREQLPDCWALHRPAVVELSWLRLTYVHANLPAAEPYLAADWHARWRPAAMARVRAVISPRLCRPGEHLLTEEESRQRRPAPPPPTQPWEPGEREPLPDQQLAEPRHWWAFYQQAVHTDLAWRRERDQRTATATPHAEGTSPPS
ncbi:hypothetical protein [Pseudonocardia acidicola]|uniref:DUF4913 domain-containing protein n=1 Tax=Pseudonocardia acidicola TaxID=2724939 RepID=A0ABX1SAW9_9PSEU|nr:hypothetical protein [Pseudonocardia acidicola]NMH97318.1 hypothetical protein [Pseudonocardia acidicola]